MGFGTWNVRVLCKTRSLATELERYCTVQTQWGEDSIEPADEERSRLFVQGKEDKLQWMHKLKQMDGQNQHEHELRVSEEKS